MYTSSIALLALAASAAAKQCLNQTVPVTISARQAVFDIDIPQTNLEVTDFILNMTTQGSNFTNVALKGYGTTTGTYQISTQFCWPDKANSSNPTVQVLTHGIGFDKTYWDTSFNNYNYSYVNTATDEFGYYTLSFDRLGVGMSSHGEPLNEIQSFLEVSATAELTKMLRAGTFPGVHKAFKKVVHIGHSFGSAQTYSLANLYPQLTDGIVLTGFTMTSTFAPYFLAGGNFQLARLNQPLKFSNLTAMAALASLQATSESLLEYLAPIDLTLIPAPQNLPNGYIIPSDIEANKYLFMKPKNYDPAILQLAERTKQAVTLGELLTLGSLTMVNNFAGPTMLFAGDADLPYCGSDCRSLLGQGPDLLARVATNFPKVAPANFSSYIHPNTGHGLNLHYNATAGYRVINRFLAGKGLQSS